MQTAVGCFTEVHRFARILFSKDFTITESEVGFCNPFFPFINIQGETLGSAEQTRVVGALVRPWLDRYLKRASDTMALFEAALSREPVAWRRR